MNYVEFPVKNLGSMEFPTFSDLEACAIMSEGAIAAVGNQLPSYLCNSISPANIHFSQPHFYGERRFETPTLQETQPPFQLESRSIPFVHHAAALHDHENNFHSTSSNNQGQSTTWNERNMEIFPLNDGAFLPIRDTQLRNTTQERPSWPISCFDHVIQAESGSPTKEETRRSRRRRSKAESNFLDNSSEHCSYRAARGFAVHPRSIAERVRRSRIAQRVKSLEAILPDSIKKAGKRRLYTDEMLDRTISYIKWLQKNIKMLGYDELAPGCGMEPSDLSHFAINNEVVQEETRFQ